MQHATHSLCLACCLGSNSGTMSRYNKKMLNILSEIIIFANVSKEGWDSGVIKEVSVSPSSDLICNFANKGKLMRLLVSVKSECFAALFVTLVTLVTLRPVCRVTPWPPLTHITHHRLQITMFCHSSGNILENRNSSINRKPVLKVTYLVICEFWYVIWRYDHPNFVLLKVENP